MDYIRDELDNITKIFFKALTKSLFKRIDPMISLIRSKIIGSFYDQVSMNFCIGDSREQKMSDDQDTLVKICRYLESRSSEINVNISRLINSSDGHTSSFPVGSFEIDSLQFHCNTYGTGVVYYSLVISGSLGSKKRIQDFIKKAINYSPEIKESDRLLYIGSGNYKLFPGSEENQRDLLVPDRYSKKFFDIVNSNNSSKNVILISGRSGMGKTTLIRESSKKLGRALCLCYLSQVSDINEFMNVLSNPEIIVDSKKMSYTKKLVIFEDIDKDLENKVPVAQLLNALDGAIRLNNVTVIFSVNQEPEIMRILNRPGRIDHVLEMNDLTDSDIQEICAKASKPIPKDLPVNVSFAEILAKLNVHGQ